MLDGTDQDLGLVLSCGEQQPKYVLVNWHDPHLHHYCYNSSHARYVEHVGSRFLAVLGIPTEEVVFPNHAFTPRIELGHRLLELFAVQPHPQLFDELLHLVGVRQSEGGSSFGFDYLFCVSVASG